MFTGIRRVLLGLELLEALQAVYKRGCFLRRALAIFAGDDHELTERGEGVKNWSTASKRPVRFQFCLDSYPIDSGPKTPLFSDRIQWKRAKKKELTTLSSCKLFDDIGRFVFYYGVQCATY